MSKTVQRYRADRELAEKLKAAAEAHEPLQIVTDERTYEVAIRGAEPAQDIWSGYDAEAALAAVRQAPRIANPMDLGALNQLIADIRADRDQDSRGRPRER